MPAAGAPSAGAAPGSQTAPAGEAGVRQAIAFWPCHVCGARVAIERQECSSCGARFLDAAAHGSHRSGGSSMSPGAGADPLGRLAGMPRSGRLALGVVLGLLLALVVPVVLALLGA